MRFVHWLSIGVAAAALVFEVRRRGFLPLVRDLFKPNGTTAFLVFLGVASGMAVVFVPNLAGASIEPAGTLSLASLANLLLILTWAAMEELIFRGALLRVLRQRFPAAVSVLVSAAAFMFAHRASAASAVTGAVLFLDGIGFALVALGTRSLIVPTLWHAAKNASVWSFGAATLQLAPGLFRLRTAGRRLDWLYLLVTAATVAAAYWAAIARSRSRLVTEGAQ
jgi:membrane protease YdiL (CAAX protease family)